MNKTKLTEKLTGGLELPPTIRELEKRPVMSTSQILVYTSMLLGKALTVIDASITDVKQNKAAKDLVKSLVWGSCEELRKWGFKKAENKGIDPFPFLSGTPNDMLV